MNLWLRLLGLLLGALVRAPLNLIREASRLSFRAWPHDLDTSLHMNNGRYWTIMDLGHVDLLMRSGLWRAVRRHGWVPVVSAAKIRVRRELRLWRRFVLEEAGLPGVESPPLSLEVAAFIAAEDALEAATAR